MNSTQQLICGKIVFLLLTCYTCIHKRIRQVYGTRWWWGLVKILICCRFGIKRSWGSLVIRVFREGRCWRGGILRRSGGSLGRLWMIMLSFLEIMKGCLRRRIISGFMYMRWVGVLGRLWIRLISRHFANSSIIIVLTCHTNAWLMTNMRNY